MDQSCYENAQHTDSQAGLLWTAGKGEAIIRRHTQALQGQPDAKPENPLNTTKIPIISSAPFSRTS